MMQVQSNLKHDLVRTGFAGMSSVIAATVTHPIDTTKIRLQLEGDAVAKSSVAYNNFFRGITTIARNEGLRGLYKGVVASWMRESIYSSLRLGLYEPFKRLFGATDPAHTSFLKKLGAAASSGALGSAIANPTDLLKIRMQGWEGEPHGLIWHVRHVYSANGLKGFYRGVSPTIYRAMLLNGTKLSTYDHIKHTVLNLKILDDGKPLHFLSSVCAGICMAITTAPMDIVKTRIMNQHPSEKHYNGIADCFVKIVREEGLFSLYKGFTPQWLRFGPFTIVQMMVWEELRKLYGMRGI